MGIVSVSNVGHERPQTTFLTPKGGGEGGKERHATNIPAFFRHACLLPAPRPIGNVLLSPVPEY